MNPMAAATVAEALRQAAERDARARVVFAQVDTDGSGTIEPAEYLRAMAQLGVYAHLPTEAEAMAAAARDFAAADTDGDGCIDEYEFLRFFTHLEAHMRQQQERRARAEAAFRRYDVDGNGTIDKMEFRAALCALGVVRGGVDAATAARCDAEFARVDANGDGGLSFDEFCAFYAEAEAKHAEALARDGRAAARFRELAGPGGQYIAKDQFWQALLGLGLFDGLTVEQAVDKVNEQFPLADVDGSGVLDEAEFCRYYSLMDGIQGQRRSTTTSGCASPAASSPAHSPFLGGASPAAARAQQLFRPAGYMGE